MTPPPAAPDADHAAAAPPAGSRPPDRPRRRGAFGRVLRIVGLLLLVLLLAAGSGFWWLGSDAGTRFLVTRLTQTLAEQGMRLQLDGTDGSLWRGFRIARFGWEGSGTAVEGEGLVARWSLPALLHRQLLVPELRAARLAVQLPPASTEPTPPPAPTPMPGALALPVTIELRRLAVDELRITPARPADAPADAPAPAPIVLRELAARLGYEGGRYRIDELGVVSDWGRLANGAVTFGDAPPHPLRLRADLTGDFRRLGYALALTGEGDLNQAAAKLTGRAAESDVAVDAQVAPLAVMPLRTARVELDGLDLRMLQPALESQEASPATGPATSPAPTSLPQTPLPQTRLRLVATASPRPAVAVAMPAAWDATLALRNAESGRYADGRLPLAALDTRIAWLQPADPAEHRLTLDDLKLTLTGPRGNKPLDASIAGDVSVHPNRSLTVAGIALPETVAKLVFDAIDVTAFVPKSLEGQWPVTALGGQLTLDRQVFALSLAQDAGRMRGLLPAGTNAEAAEVIARGRVDESMLRLDEARVRLGRSSLAAKGQAGLSAPHRLQFAGNFKAIDLKQWLPAGTTPEPRWGDGMLGGEWSVDGIALPGFDGLLTLKLVDSRYAGEPLAADVRARLALDGQWAPARVTQVNADIRLATNRIRANGALGQANDKLALDVDVPAPQRLEPRLTGRATLNGEVTGAFDRLRGRFALRGERVRFAQPDGDVRIGSLRLDANGPLTARPAPQAPLAITLAVRNANAAGRALTAADLKIDGSLQSHRFDLAASGEGQKLQLNGEGSGQLDRAAAWRARLAALTLDGAVPLRLSEPADLRVDAVSLRLDRFGVALADGRIRLERVDVGWADKPAFNARGEARDLAVPRLLAFAGIDPRSDPGYEALRALRLDAGWDLKGTGVEDLSGTARVDLREDGAAVAARDGSGAGPIGLSGNNGAQIRLTQGRLDGQFDLALPTLAFTHPMTAPDLVLDGQLRLAGRVGGTLARPLWDASVAGERLAVLQRSVGWRLTDGTLDARLAGRSVELKTFRFQSGDGSIELRGRADLLEKPRPVRAGTPDPNAASTLPIDGRFELTATQFQVPIGPGQRVALSGKTDLSSGADGLGLRGQLRIDHGIIEIQGSSAPSLPGDVRIIDPHPAPGQPKRTGDGREEKAPRSAIRIATDLAVELGDRLRVTGNGLAARLTGNLRVLGLLPEQPRLTGAITIVDGSYQAYGQNLRIDKGIVRFNGPVDNPALDLTAKRPFLPVEVGIAITGTALDPKIALFSTPEMSETDRLTWLVLGTDPSQAPNAAQTLALRQAATALLTDDDGSYKPGVAERLGLDVFNFGYGSDTGPAQGVKESMSPTGLPGSNSTTASAAQQEVVTLGKRIGSRLFVSYEQGVRGLWNLLRIQYTLTRRLSVRAQSGSDNAVDLMYSYSFD